MIFVFNKWDNFCKQLKDNNRLSIPACEVGENLHDFLVLKHDVENNVQRAFKMAQIENKYGHRGSYYVQAYLLDDLNNVEMLKKMSQMGHEISYHYDVMDSCHGNITLAKEEFDKFKAKFESFGFGFTTVCQHGNPIVERVGYTSNRDFFRNKDIQSSYPEISDIMVNFPQKHNVNYTYYSDAGRKFKLIFDPFNNDIINSDDKNISYESLDELFSALDNKVIISTHPHRWSDSAVKYLIKEKIFKIIKFVAKIMVKIPLFKKIMSKYYYLAKKI